jgi:hypothetical protein
VAGLAGLLLVAGGCSVVHTGTSATKSMIESFAGTGDKRPATNAVATVQAGVMREADQYVAAVAQATDDFSAKVGTLEARDAAQQWKLNEATVALVIATGESPVVNAASMVVLASLSRSVVEDYWVGQKFGESARPLLEVHRQLESDAWGQVQRLLTEQQQQELRELIRKSREKFPHQRYVSDIRLPDLVTTLGDVPVGEQRQKPGSLFSLLYLNPLAGLDPTTQAIEQTRFLAQRAMYYAQRMPMLLSWQVQLMTYQMAAQPEARQVLSDLQDVARSTTVFAKTAEGLPQLVNDQREAAINQLFAGIAAERTNLIAELASQESRLRELLPQVRDTLSAGNGMATSLNAAITSLDAFVHYVSPPDTNAVPQPVDTNSPAFNVLDYGKAAGQIGAMAKDLNALLVSVDQSLPQFARVSQQATVDAKAVVNHAFRLGLVLIVALGVVAVLVVWVCRNLGRGRPRPESAPAPRVE